MLLELQEDVQKALEGAEAKDGFDEWLEDMVQGVEADPDDGEQELVR